MNWIGIIAIFTVGYIAGVVTVVTWALMAASSEDSRRREREEDFQRREREEYSPSKEWADAGEWAMIGLVAGLQESEEQDES